MKGVHTARKIVRDYLADRLPVALAAMRRRESISITILPDPKKYLAESVRPPDASSWPSLWVDNVADSEPARTLTEPGPNPVYECRYELFIVVWMSTKQHRGLPEIELAANRMSAAIIECFIDRPSCGDPDFVIDLATLRAQPSDPWDAGTTPAVAVRVDFEAIQVEQHVRPPLWTDPTGTPVVTVELL